MGARAFKWRAIACVASIFTSLASSIQVDPTDYDSIRSATKSIATDMMAYYVGDQPGQTPGYLPGNGVLGGYFWWIGGGMFGTMVNYWYHTGDSTWNDATAQAIYFQSDPSSGGFFDSNNVSFQLGNDDQAFWAFAAIEAAEYKFPNPPAGYPSWLAMGQGVFNQQVQRWDDETCNGGLRWQANNQNKGYNYKNAISNGCFFQVAARLGKYTGNHTIINWATKTWDWSVQSGLVIPDEGYKVIDGIYVDTCKPRSPSDGGSQWTYNVGVYLYGAAVMWNINDQAFANMSDVWQQRTLGLLDAAGVFFINGNSSKLRVLTEVICEPYTTCKIDQTTFKAYLARWLRVTAIVAPFTAPNVTSLLADSVTAAAESCDAAGQDGGTMCGQQWYLNPETYDGRSGIGMQMNALEVLQTLIPVAGPLTYKTGDSKPDPSAGSGSTTNRKPVTVQRLTITSADRGGAWFLTILFGLGALGGGFWVISD